MGAFYIILALQIKATHVLESLTFNIVTITYILTILNVYMVILLCNGSKLESCLF